MPDESNPLWSVTQCHSLAEYWQAIRSILNGMEHTDAPRIDVARSLETIAEACTMRAGAIRQNLSLPCS